MWHRVVTSKTCHFRVSWGMAETSSGFTNGPPVGDPYVKTRRNFLVGLASCVFGWGMTTLAGSFLVYDQTRSVGAVGLIVVCISLPSVALASLSISLTRRLGVPKLYVLMTVTGSFAYLLPVLLSLFGHLTTAGLLAFFLLNGISSGLGTPTSSLMRARIAPKGEVTEFNAATTRTASQATLAGILVGGVAYSVLGATWVFVLGGLLWIPLILAVRPMTKEPVVETPEESTRLSDVVATRRSHPEVLAAFRYAAFVFLISGYAVTFPAIASQIGKNPSILSLLQSASVLGGLTVVIAVRKIHGRVSWGRAQRVCFLIAGVAMLALAFVSHRQGHTYWTLTGAALVIIPIGFALNLDASILNGLIQVGAPAATRTSVLTVFAIIPMVAIPVSQELIGLISDYVSVTAALLVIGIVTMVMIVIPHGAMREGFAIIDDSLTSPTPGLVIETAEGEYVETTIGQIEDQGQPIADQGIGPEVPYRPDIER